MGKAISFILTGAEPWLHNVHFAFSQIIVSKILSPANCFLLIQISSNFFYQLKSYLRPLTTCMYIIMYVQTWNVIDSQISRYSVFHAW